MSFGHPNWTCTQFTLNVYFWTPNSEILAKALGRCDRALRSVDAMVITIDNNVMF